MAKHSSHFIRSRRKTPIFKSGYKAPLSINPGYSPGFSPGSRMGLIVIVLLVYVSALAAPAARAQEPQITVFVEEGRHSLNGHVFISLSDGVRPPSYCGFYSKNKALALISKGGGEVRDDSATDWDVKRVYNISKEAYLKAFDAIFAWKNSDEAWWIDHHCGDFAETVLESAGVNLPLNWRYSGSNRPGIFGQYIREHGGIAHYPFEGDWIVESSDFMPAGTRIPIEHEGDGYRASGAMYRGSATSIYNTHVFTLDELRQVLPKAPLEILQRAQGEVTIRLELNISDDGQTLDLVRSGDIVRFHKVVNEKTGVVVAYAFDGVEKGGLPPLHATFRRATPGGEEN